MRAIHYAVIFALAMPVAIEAPAIAAGAAKYIALRHEKMKLIARNYKTIADETKKDAPDRAAIKASATVIAANARNISKWFPRGSGPESGLKTHAKAEIWQRPQEFRDDAKALETRAGQLAALAGSADVGALRAQAGSIGQSCKSCHEAFQVRD